MEPLIRDISDTARWVAMFRAQESERADALFRDPLAGRLAGERGAQILANMPHAAENSWAYVMRTYLFDRMISGRVAAGVRTVVNLAAGLDARPYRMELPADLHWVEVDLPPLVEYKEGVLTGEQPRCRFERIGMDLAEREGRRALLQRLGNGLAVTEGLLIYLSEEEVGQLAVDLADAGMEYWAIDLASPGLLQMLQARVGQNTAQAGAPLRFAPENRTAFFEAFGWKAMEVHSVFDTAVELGRMPQELLNGPPLPPGMGEIWSGDCLLARM